MTRNFDFTKDEYYEACGFSFDEFNKIALSEINEELSVAENIANISKHIKDPVLLLLIGYELGTMAAEGIM